MVTHRRVLLVYPRFPKTFWGLQYALPLLGRKATMPPLGLITVAAMCPKEWEMRLVDLNCEELTEQDLSWCDLVFVSAMITQKEGLFEIGDRAMAAGKTVVFGGPYPTAFADVCEPHCHVVVAGEAEVTLPPFLRDLEQGTLQCLYRSEEKPDVTQTPLPRFDLLHMQNYLSVPVQYSRGCPFRCEFCDIIVMFGRRPRTKTPAQVLKELDAVYATGFRGEIFIVDDNFIGNRKEVRHLLPELKRWNKAHDEPFSYGTEASVDLAGLPEVLKEMVDARFRWVFLGLESPSEESLRETKKLQNVKRSLQGCVDTILSAGLYVTGGFIIGFDSDDETIFERQRRFIAGSGIPFAMLGLLEALRGTPLHTRLAAEGRLLPEESRAGLQMSHGSTNILTRIERRALLTGFAQLIREVYAPRALFDRAFDASARFRKPEGFFDGLRRLSTSLRDGLRYFPGLPALFRFVKDMPPALRMEPVRLFWRLLRHRPDQLGALLDYTVMGTHLYRFAHEQALPQVEQGIARLPADPPASGRLEVLQRYSAGA
jgi:radical SAM superfamily enzyme YgiQ (UPF0313 family)